MAIDLKYGMLKLSCALSIKNTLDFEILVRKNIYIHIHNVSVSSCTNYMLKHFGYVELNKTL